MEEFFIVGAGPVGLTCALFLQKEGQKFRIIDKALKSTSLTKALAVNARSFEIMRELDLEDKLKDIGLKINQITMNLCGSRVMLPCDFLDVLIIPQTKTEEFLEKNLKERGVSVERGVELITFEEKNGSYKLTLKSDRGMEEVTTRYLIGADGMHSTVRQVAQIPFIGKDYGFTIYGADCYLEGDPFPQSNIFMKNTKEANFGIVIPIDNKLYRILSNRELSEPWILENAKIKTRVWDAKFHIHCKHAAKLNQGNLYLMGDAGHVHSPVGGRGMNLGIEDAHAFVTLWKENRLQEYSSARKKRSLQILKETDLGTRFLLLKGPFWNFCKKHIVPLLLKIPKFKVAIIRRNMGVG